MTTLQMTERYVRQLAPIASPEPVKAGTLDSERRARDHECSRNARTRGAPMYVLLVPPDPPWVKKPVDKKNWVPREVKLSGGVRSGVRVGGLYSVEGGCALQQLRLRQ